MRRDAAASSYGIRAVTNYSWHVFNFSNSQLLLALAWQTAHLSDGAANFLIMRKTEGCFAVMAQKSQEDIKVVANDKGFRLTIRG